METIKLGDYVTNDFKVSDNYHIGVTGLNIGNFNLKIYNDDGIEKSQLIPVNLQELGDGNYRLTYLPDSEGNWSTFLKHSLYFPYGKGSNATIKQYDLTDIGDMLKRTLGLTQENYYIFDTTYDADDNIIGSKIRTYLDGNSVGTSNNIIAEYTVTATYLNDNLETYSVVKI